MRLPRLILAAALMAVAASLTLTVALSGPAAAAAKRDARAMLVASTPAEDAVIDAVPEVIALTFAEPAQLLSLSLRLPDGSVVDAEPEDTDSPARATRFRYRLPAAYSQPGNYSLSYLLVSKSFKSLNGFIHFRVAGDPAVTEEPAAADSDAAAPTR